MEYEYAQLIVVITETWSGEKAGCDVVAAVICLIQEIQLVRSFDSLPK